MTLCRETRKVHQEEGELLFTEEGISGICAMQMARLITGPGFVAELNLLHRLFGSLRDAEAEMFRRKSRFASLDPSWLLNGMLPDRVSYAVCKQAGLFMRGRKSPIFPQMKSAALRIRPVTTASISCNRKIWRMPR